MPKQRALNQPHVDLGANTGRYSRLLCRHHTTVLAADIDPLAVERHYLRLKAEGVSNVLPLILDVANPSPGVGFQNAERAPFIERCRANTLLALALIHHMVITAGLPPAQCAEIG